ncbi:MAG: glutamate racemase [Clostridia bacterium]|jgi:glutamate racemase|nr:glutamate racemase [Clostridia bacterium]
MSNHQAAPIGVFDSGVGGLSVVREMFLQLPRESFVYFADTAHVPYGGRSPEEIKGFSFGITRFLLQQGCKMIIIACNTTNSVAYQDLIEAFDIPFIGVIEPGVDKALQTTKNGRVGLIATEATVNSGFYQQMLKSKNPAVKVMAKACPLFVPCVEKGETEGEAIRQAAKQYLAPILAEDADTLVLGCTHYPFLLPLLQRLTGRVVTFVDPAKETVKRARERLEADGLLNDSAQVQHRFFVSGDPVSFARIGGLFLEREIEQVEKISLE